MEGGDIKFSYETLWKFIIRPPRDEYTESMLGNKIFKYNSKQYERKDFDLMSTQGYILKCSFIEPTKAFRTMTKMPVVIYLHGNSSSRMEGLNMAKVLLKRDINLFIFDFAGSGLSEGEYISLGYHENHDLGNVIDFVEKIPGVGKIGLWGRSMGAATGMIYTHKDKRVRAVCLDSPFADFERLARELVKKHLSFNLPGFIVGGMLSIVRGTILKKNGLDIDKLKPIEVAGKTTTPIIFVHAIKDELIDVKHSMDLFNMYAGQEKSLKCCETGGHNSKRSSNILNLIGDFFAKYLHNYHKEKPRINNNQNNLGININKNYDFSRNNNNLNELNKFNNNKFNNNIKKLNNIKEEEEEEDEIIINESQISLNEIKGINPKFKEDMNSQAEDEPFDDKNSERMQYVKKREKLDQQRFNDMMSLIKSIKPDIRNSFSPNNFNNNNNNNNNCNNMNQNNNMNFNQQNMNNMNINNNAFNNNLNSSNNINNNNNFNNNFNNFNNYFNNNPNMKNNMNNNTNNKNNPNSIYDQMNRKIKPKNMNNQTPSNNNINNMNNMNNMNINKMNNMMPNSMNNMNPNSMNNMMPNRMNNMNPYSMNNMMPNSMNNMNPNSMNNMVPNSMNNMNMNSMNNMNNSNINFNNLRNGFRINNNNNNNN